MTLKPCIIALSATCSLFACSGNSNDSNESGYIEVPYPEETGVRAPFCQWQPFGSGPGEPPPMGPDGTAAHQGSARFPVPNSGSCSDIHAEDVDRAIIQEAEKVCDSTIEGLERGCYRIFDADDTPECVFFAYYFSSCEPTGE